LLDKTGETQRRSERRGEKKKSAGFFQRFSATFAARRLFLGPVSGLASNRISTKRTSTVLSSRLLKRTSAPARKTWAHRKIPSIRV
jgi:hypothetical protein